jgi:hypothetical protein
MYNLAPAPAGMPMPAMPPSQALSVAQEQASMMATARDLGALMFKTQFKPKWADNVEAVQYVCLYALSLGIPPVQAFSAFYVIPGGVPALTTKGAAALIASKGGAVSVEKSTDKECHLVGTRLDGRTAEVRVTIEQFRHLAQKDNWTKYAQDMLYAAAFRRLANRLFPDVLQGLDAFDPREFDEEGVPVSRAKPSAVSALLASKKAAIEAEKVEDAPKQILAKNDERIEKIEIPKVYVRGHKALSDMIVEHLKPYGITPDWRKKYAVLLTEFLEREKVPTDEMSMRTAISEFVAQTKESEGEA